MYNILQWYPSNRVDTIGPEESVLISEVSLFQRLKSTQTWYLERKKVSCLERCPYFKGVLIEGRMWLISSLQRTAQSEEYRANATGNLIRKLSQRPPRNELLQRNIIPVNDYVMMIYWFTDDVMVY